MFSCGGRRLRVFSDGGQCVGYSVTVGGCEGVEGGVEGIQ